MRAGFGGMEDGLDEGDLVEGCDGNAGDVGGDLGEGLVAAEVEEGS